MCGRCRFQTRQLRHDGPRKNLSRRSPVAKRRRGFFFWQPILSPWYFPAASCLDLCILGCRRGHLCDQRDPAFLISYLSGMFGGAMVTPRGTGIRLTACRACRTLPLRHTIPLHRSAFLSLTCQFHVRSYRRRLTCNAIQENGADHLRYHSNLRPLPKDI